MKTYTTKNEDGTYYIFEYDSDKRKETKYKDILGEYLTFPTLQSATDWCDAKNKIVRL